MLRDANFVPGEYYHIYNRGVNKNKIFLADGDWRYFQHLLYLRNDATGYVRIGRSKKFALSKITITDPLVDIQAYCLMPNHFHILLKERVEGGVTTYMKRLLTSYSMYINKKYDRSGPLMCRPFRSKHIDSDEYMRWVISYIHLNPADLHQPGWKDSNLRIGAPLERFLSEYPYASYCDYYVGDREESIILNKTSLPFFISDLEDPKNMFAKYRENTI